MLVLLLFSASLGADNSAGLAAECDELLRGVVRKPYGWALPATDAQPDSRLPRDSQVVDLDPLRTPTAALLLHEAGKAMKRDEYGNAARQLARGLIASQQSNGRIPSRAVFGSTVASRDPAGVLPARQPTCAAMAALLTLSAAQRDETLMRGAALRAASFLVREQASNGLFLSLVQTNSAPQPERLLRLDREDFRNCTLALALAAQATGDKTLDRAAQRAIDQLIRFRIGESRSAAGLWQAAYEPDGAASQKITDQENAVDIIACRMGLQTLLWHHLLTDNRASLDAMTASAKALEALRYEDKLWRRQYPFRGNELTHRVRGPAPREELGPFAKPKPFERDFAAVGEFGLPELLARIAAASQPRDADAVKSETARLLNGLTRLPLDGNAKPEDADSMGGRLLRIDQLVQQLNAERTSTRPVR